MNKKLILASAIAAIVNPASAATWDTNGFLVVKHTDEGIEASSELTGVDISGAYVRLGVGYAVNDTVTFTNTVAKGTNNSWPASFTSVPAGTATNTAAATTSLQVASITASGTTLALETQGATGTATRAGVVVGDQFTIASDTTNKIYRVVGLDGTTTEEITITPTLAAATTADDALTFKKPMTVTFGLLDGQPTYAQYRVTQLTTSNSTTVDALIPTPEVAVSPAGLTAADSVITFTAATGTGVAMDTLAATFTAASSAPQWVASTTTAFDGIVDVEQGRLQFTVSTNPVHTNMGTTKKADTFSYKIQETDGVNGAAVSGSVTALSAAETKGVLAVGGSWDFLDDGTATGISLTQTTDASHIYSTTSTQIGTVTATSDTLTVTMTGTGAASGVTQDGTTASHSLDIVSTNAAAVIPVADYSPTFTVSYDPAVTGVDKTKALSITGAGSWTLNGVAITAYGVPMGSTVSRFLWINNSGATDAVLSASLTSGGTRYPTTGEYSIGTAAGQSNTEIGSLLATAMSTAGVTLPDSSRANITVTAPSKDADVTMSAAYKHIADADRLTIETSDTTDGTTK